MLVLSRKESQRIRLGDSIVVTIVKISGDKVRVGIEAPSDVLVLRDELEVRTQEASVGVPRQSFEVSLESFDSQENTGAADPASSGAALPLAIRAQGASAPPGIASPCDVPLRQTA